MVLLGAHTCSNKASPIYRWVCHITGNQRWVVMPTRGLCESTEHCGPAYPALPKQRS